MTKLFASIGVFAVGAASLHAAPAQNLSSMEASKPWSLSASLRGFYDDNYNTSPKGTARDSFGFEVSPSASLNLPLDQTFIGLSYIYSMKYYEDRVNHKADHSHQFNAKLDHAFTERYKLELNDSFVIAQEPEVLNPSGILVTPLRAEGSNIRNTASANFIAQMTQLLGLTIGYANTIYDFEQDATDIQNDPALKGGNPFGVGSYSALLDRVEHSANIDLRWQVLRQTVAILGYRFQYVDYTSRDPIAVNFDFSTFSFVPVLPSRRDNRSHYLYVGADHNFNSKLNASVRVGAQYTDYFNAGFDDVSPYADANLTYTYAPGSYLQAGVKHSRNATDIASIQDQESTAIYSTLVHRLTAKFTGTLLGQVQRSEGGQTVFGTSSFGSVDNYFIFGANLQYKISPHWSAETGYNFDRVDSDSSGRSYTRNRVYIGIRATY